MSPVKQLEALIEHNRQWCAQEMTEGIYRAQCMEFVPAAPVLLAYIRKLEETFRSIVDYVEDLHMIDGEFHNNTPSVAIYAHDRALEALEQ